MLALQVGLWRLPITLAEGRNKVTRILVAYVICHFFYKIFSAIEHITRQLHLVVEQKLLRAFSVLLFEAITKRISGCAQLSGNGIQRRYFRKIFQQDGLEFTYFSVLFFIGNVGTTLLSIQNLSHNKSEVLREFGPLENAKHKIIYLCCKENVKW